MAEKKKSKAEERRESAIANAPVVKVPDAPPAVEVTEEMQKSALANAPVVKVPESEAIELTDEQKEAALANAPVVKVPDPAIDDEDEEPEGDEDEEPEEDEDEEEEKAKDLVPADAEGEVTIVTKEPWGETHTETMPAPKVPRK